MMFTDSPIDNINTWPILENVTDSQREELKKAIGEKFSDFAKGKGFDEDHNPMDVERWDHWTITYSEGEGLKLGTVNNILFLMSKMSEIAEPYEPVSFEVFKFICIAITNK